MNVLDKVKTMNRQDVLDKISGMALREYGVFDEPLAEHLTKIKNLQKPSIAAALNNADTKQVLLEVLRENPRKVLEGLSIAAYGINAAKKVLCLPAGQEALADELKELADEYQTEVKAEFLDVRANKETIMIHIVTAAVLSDAFAGNDTDYAYISVNGENLKKVPAETKIEELADVTKAKALLLGYRFYGPEAASLTVREAKIDNGVIGVLTDEHCLVCEAEKILRSSRKQSCGKCVFCREGLIQLSYMQKEIAEGRGKAEYLDLSEEIGAAMEVSTPCSMGQLSAEIVRTGIRKFLGEYEAHIKKKRCPANVCKAFVHIYIDPKRCSGCGNCMDVCPKDSIIGKEGYIHMIDTFDCEKCGACKKACPNGAIMQTIGRLPKLPDRLTRAGKFRKK